MINGWLPRNDCLHREFGYWDLWQGDMFSCHSYCKRGEKALKKKPNVFNTFKRDYQLWIMIIPAIIVIFVFQYVPMYGLQLAFRTYSLKTGITGGTWVGMKYFKQFFAAPNGIALILNTIKIAGLSIIIGFPFPIVLALLFNQLRSKKFQRVLQTTAYMPHFISIVVLVSMLNIFLNNDGIFTHALRTIGIFGEDFNPIGSANAFLPIYLISGIWQEVGWGSIIYLAALSGVDKQLYDACKIDGASRLQIIWHVDIPAIMPTVILILILNAGNILNVGFDKIYLMTNSMNASRTQVISTYTYSIGLGSHQYSYATAIGLFNTVVNFVCLTLVNTIAKHVGETSLW